MHGCEVLATRGEIERDAIAALARRRSPTLSPYVEVMLLSTFIAESAAKPGEDLDIRLLGVPFEYIEMAERVRDADPYYAELRAAQLELVRDVATYFVKARAFWEAAALRQDATVAQPIDFATKRAELLAKRRSERRDEV